ncbi:MAG: hypothetical protein OT477_19895 [Chloroflexi bacterium]|nr:hypothetical protein [Chloroflexota bacterium]
MMDDYTNPVKLLLSYDMLPEAGQEYYQFVLGRYIPTMQSMGLQMSEAWSTQYGNGPDRLVGFVARDEQSVFDLLESDTWRLLNDQLFNYITNFNYKVIPYKQGFQI